jgi:hypothetical protein
VAAGSVRSISGHVRASVMASDPSMWLESLPARPWPCPREGAMRVTALSPWMADSQSMSPGASAPTVLGDTTMTPSSCHDVMRGVTMVS